MNSRIHAWSGCLMLTFALGLSACSDDSERSDGSFSGGGTETSGGTTSDHGDGDPGDGDGDTGNGDGDGDTGDGDGDTGDGDGDTGDGDGDTGDGDGDTGDGDGDTGDGDGDGDTGNDACPAEPGDDDCTLCTKSSCCVEFDACNADEQCVCFKDCIDGGGNNNQCKNMCDVQGSNPNYQTLRGCQNSFCPVACG